MHWFVDHVHHREQGEASAPHTRGLVLNWAWLYDCLMWFVTHGREQTFRHMIADQAQFHPGETVLDVGVAPERWRWSPKSASAQPVVSPALMQLHE